MGAGFKTLGNGDHFRRGRIAREPQDSESPGAPSLSFHPAWRVFVDFCHKLQHGEIERLKIQDGLPVLAEVTKKKVKFAP